MGAASPPQLQRPGRGAGCTAGAPGRGRLASGGRKGLARQGAGFAEPPPRAHARPGPPAPDAYLSPAEKHLLRRSRSGDILAKNPVVRSKSYNTPLLNPVAEHEAEGSAAGATGVRRHSVSEMTSCPDGPGQGPTGDFGPSPGPQSGPCPSRLYPPTQPPEPGAAHGSPPSSSPENLVDHILESADSDSEGIFIDFGRRGSSGASQFEGPGGRQSVV